MRIILALLLLAAMRPAIALEPAPVCVDAIRRAETASRLPPKLLGAIALVESARVDPRTGKVAPWPWTINVGGVGSFFESKAEAIAAVEALRASGVRSVDVGCMQVNLMHHPDAFASLDDAFDPALNAAYAALFLTRLRGQLGDWDNAAAAYHSQTPDLGEAYRQKVAVYWTGAAPPRFVTGRAAVPSIDPHGIYTPEFRTRLAEMAADRASIIAAGIIAPPPRPGRPRRGVLHASLER